MRIEVNDTAAIIIDYQEKLIPAMNEKRELLEIGRASCRERVFYSV